MEDNPAFSSPGGKASLSATALAIVKGIVAGDCSSSGAGVVSDLFTPDTRPPLIKCGRRKRQA